MKILHHLHKFLTVNDKTDIHKRSALRNHIDIGPFQRGESLLQHTVQTYDILSDHRNLRLIVIHDDIRKLRKLLHHLVDLLGSIHSHRDIGL